MGNAGGDETDERSAEETIESAKRHQGRDVLGEEPAYDAGKAGEEC